MDISAIIPTYNRGPWLKAALDSIFAQDHPVKEVIVVDDGSDDETHEVLQAYPQMLVLSSQRQGPAAARNLGAKNANCPWLTFLDSDDQWLPNKIKEQVHFHQQQSHIKLSYSDEIWIRKGKRVNACKHHKKENGWIYPRALELCLISPSSVMLSRELFFSVGAFDESLWSAEDYDLWLKISAHHEVHHIAKPLIIKYGGHVDQLSTQPGIDRYRIIALENMMKDNQLKPSWREQTRLQLLERASRHEKGCRKYGRVHEAENCKHIIKTWSSDQDLATQPEPPKHGKQL
jgi:glycosyltransferase involved in cell wall biosynthesis